MNKHEKINHLDSDSNELSCQRLDDSPLDPIELKSSKFDSKYLVPDSDNVELFVNDVVLNNETIWSYLDREDGKWYECTLLEFKYFRLFPDFIEVVKRLPDNYEYSEQVNAFIACCQAMDLLDRRHDWSIDPKKTYPYYEGRTGSEIFNRLVETLREDWKRNNRQAKVNARANENKARHEEYCRYIDALFGTWSRLVVLRFDLGYKGLDVYNIDINVMLKDLIRFFGNMRHKKKFWLFKGLYSKVGIRCRQRHTLSCRHFSSWRQEKWLQPCLFSKKDGRILGGFCHRRPGELLECQCKC